MMKDITIKNEGNYAKVYRKDMYIGIVKTYRYNMNDVNIEDITVKKQGIYIRVYWKGQRMWTENTKNILKSNGATRFKMFASIYHLMLKQPFIPNGMEELHKKEINHNKHYPYGDD